MPAGLRRACGGDAAINTGQDVAGRLFLSFISSENCLSAIMFALRGCGGFSRALRAGRAQRVLPMVSPHSSILLPRRTFHAAPALWSVKSQVLKDVGEGESMRVRLSSTIQSTYLNLLLLGITEVQIIQWYVEEGAHIDEWNPLCQYQSDKAVDDVSYNCYSCCFARDGMLTRTR